MSMDAMAALRILAAQRGEAIVVPTMSGARGWASVSTRTELDLPVSGAMGKASSVALGLALAQPNRQVIVLDGDGSLLMNLGSVVTIAGMRPKNLVHVVCQNEVYEITGGQPIPNAERVDFAGIALAAGFVRAHTFHNVSELERDLPALLAADGPSFVTLKLQPFTWADSGTRRRTIDAARALQQMFSTTAA